VLCCHRARFSEVAFDAENMLLVLSTYTDGTVQTRHSVALRSVYLTESAVPNMLTLRTHDTAEVPAGYLGTYSVSQWSLMAREINAALAQMAVARDTRCFLGSNLSGLSQVSGVEVAGAVAATEVTIAADTVGLRKGTGVFSDEPDHLPAEAGDATITAAPAPSVFLTESPYRPAGPVATSEEPPHTAEVSTSELQHLADLGYAAFQELAELYPLSMSVPFSPRLTPRPPRELNIAHIQATNGPQYSLLVGEHDVNDKNNKKVRRPRRHVAKHIKTDLHVCPLDSSSRFSDLIRGALDTYYSECTVLRRLREASASTITDIDTTSLVPATGNDLITTSAGDAPADADPSAVTGPAAAVAEEHRHLHFDDLFSPHTGAEVHSTVSGALSEGELLQRFLTEVGCWPPSPSPSPSQASSVYIAPSPPRQPRRSSRWVRSPSKQSTTAKEMFPTRQNRSAAPVPPNAALEPSQEIYLELTSPNTPSGAPTTPRPVTVRRINVEIVAPFRAPGTATSMTDSR
jgi:hypothetical protein